MYEEYAILDAQIRGLTEKKDILKEQIIQDMVERGTVKEEHGLGKFTISYLKKWTYPEKTIALGEKFKAQKAKDESTGDAKYTEEESLRFTSIKI